MAVALRGDAESVVCEVWNDGPPIPAGAQEAIFEPFRQGDGSATRDYGGVGLGLYIVRRYLDLLGGRIFVESEVGRGSTFRVWVPARVPAAHAQLSSDNRVRRSVGR